MAIREKIIIEGDDRASKSFKSAGGNFEKMGKTFKKVAITGGIAVAGRALIKAGAAAVGMAIDAEEAESAFKTAFGEALPEATAFVEDFALKAGFATHELQQMLAITGTVIQGIGGTEAESAKLSETMAVLAGDVASFSNASGGAEAVLAALQSAINGEREALKTYGLAVSETEVQERALQNTQKERAGDLTRLEKAEATVQIATEKAGKAIGDLDRTQDSAANTLRRLGAMGREAQTALGEELLPALEAFLPVMEELIPVAEELGVELAGTFTTVAIVASEAAPLIPNVLSKWNTAFNSAINVGAGLTAMLTEIFTVGKADTSGLVNMAEAAAHANDITSALRALRNEQVPGISAATRYANVMAEVARESDLSRTAIEVLGQASGATEQQQLDALITLRRLGETDNWRTGNMNLLTDAIVRQRVELGLIDLDYQDAAFRMHDFGTATGDVGPPLEDLSEKEKEAAEAAQDLAQANAEAAASFRSELLGAVMDFITGFEELPDEIETTMEECEENLTDRVDALQGFWENLSVLAGAGFGALAEMIREEGPAAAGLLEDMVGDMETAARLDEAIKTGRTDMGRLTGAYADQLELAGLPDRMRIFGQEMMDKMVQGIRSVDVGAAIAAQVTGGVNAATGTLPSGSRIGGHSEFAHGTWDVPGSGPVAATLHGGEAVIPPSGSSGRADFARALAAEMAKMMPEGDDTGPGGGGNHVTIEQITVLVPAGTTVNEAINAGGAQGAIEALMS